MKTGFGEMRSKNRRLNIFFLVSCFAATLEVIMEENMRAMRIEDAKKILDEAIVLETKKKKLFNAN